jgi:hypothetical protein
MDSIRGTALAKSLRPMVQLNCCGERFCPPYGAATAPKMCPPGQGMSGRVYQIDAGWMGGAASIGLGNFLFGLSSPGILVSTDIGVAAWAEGSMFFENVDPMRPMTHFPAQLEAVSRQK